MSELVLTIQRQEFGMAITAEDQPDLLDVPAFYGRGAGNFWAAVEEGELVGTIGLLDIGHGQGALRKMSSGRRGAGGERQVARHLLNALIDWARMHGFREVYLGTTQWFEAARRFYLRNGFVEVPQAALPAAFPLMEVDSRFYQLRLADAASGR